MKINTVFHIFVIFMVWLLLVMPQIVVAQQASEIQQATEDARRDAKLNVSPTAWGAAGFLCGCFVPAYAFLSMPEVPVATLLGKTPTYVNIYTQVYQENVKRQRIQASVIGCAICCAIGSAVSTAYYYLIVFPQCIL